MTKKVIAVDIDDVIADSTEALRLVANKIPGVSLDREHYQVEGKYWGYYESVWASNGVDHLVSFEKLHNDMAESQAHVKLILGARAGLEALSQKYKIVLITSREVEWIDATKIWVDDNLRDVVSGLIFVHHKNTDGRTKGDACIEVGAEWLIDDNYDHCRSAQAVGVQPLLYGKYGWNRAVQDKTIPRALNWEAIVEFFDGQS